MGPPLEPAACVTAIVTVSPPPVTVIVPLRAVPVLAVTAALKVPLPEPLAGDTVSQEVLFELAVQATFEVTSIVVWEAAFVGERLVGEVERELVPGCVMVTVAV